MKCQQVLVFLSTMIIVSHCEEGTCGSAENPKNIPVTVQDHLKNTVRSLWTEEILKEQTNGMTVFLSKELVERDSKIEEEFAQKDRVINRLTRTVNAMKTQMKLKVLKVR